MEIQIQESRLGMGTMGTFSSPVHMNMFRQRYARVTYTYRWKTCPTCPTCPTFRCPLWPKYPQLLLTLRLGLLRVIPYWHAILQCRSVAELPNPTRLSGPTGRLSSPSLTRA
jgi:hypothetical protein